MRFFQQQLLNDTDNVTEDRILQVIWDLRIGREKFMVSPAFPPLLTLSFYFTLCTLFMLFDMFGKNVSWIQQYKLQTDRVVTWPMISRAVRHTCLNTLCLVAPATISQWIWVPPTPLPKAAPTLIEFLYQTWAILLLFDFQYFAWHSIHHKNRWLYRNFHGFHHQYHSTFSWTAQYLHPWELFTVGFFATVDGWFFDCHPMTYWGFMLLNVFVSVDAHSGYDLPLFPHRLIPFGIYGGGPKHDMHHMKPLTNFEPFFSHWDRLFGWECPALRAGGVKCAALIKWEEDNRNRRLARHATQLMVGSENGFLEAVTDDKELTENGVNGVNGVSSKKATITMANGHSTPKKED